MNSIAEKLIGRWHIDKEDRNALKQMGNVTVVFDSDKLMRYITFEKGSIQITSLEYRIEKDVIISSISPGSTEEHTKFNFDNDNTIILESDGLKSKFIRDILQS